MKDDTIRLWSGGAKETRAPERPEQRRGEENLIAPNMGDRMYKAFDVKENPTRMHIRTALQGSFYPSYHYLRDMRFGHDFQSIFTLIYTFMTVEVTGEILAPVVHAIDAGDCKRIYEFHSRLYDPPERGATIIRGIRLLSEEGAEIGPLINPHQPH